MAIFNYERVFLLNLNEYCVKIGWMLILCCLSWSTHLSAQNHNITAIYTDRDGLITNRIKCLYPLGNNTLLVGTSDGLFFYDGYDFTLVNRQKEEKLKLSNDFIVDLAIDDKQFIWVGTRDGLNIIHPTQQQVERYFVQGKTGFLPFTNDIATVMIEKGVDHKMWTVVGGQLYLEQQRTFIPILPDVIQEIIRFEIDESGDLYLLSNDGQFFILNKEGKLKLNKSLEELVEGDLTTRLYFMNLSPIGALEFLNYELDQAYRFIAGNRLVPMAIDSSYVYSLDRQIKATFQFNDPNNLIRDYCFTDEDALWIATQEGLIKMTKQQYFFESIPELNGQSCRGMFEDKDGYI